jgi:tetratricopeptide (TPR) repeat protein
LGRRTTVRRGRRLDQPDRQGDGDGFHKQIADAFGAEEVLQGRDGRKAGRRLAAACHELGLVALDRGRTADAEAWLQKSLALNEALGDRAALAANHHQIGMACLKGGRLAEAEASFTRALVLFESEGWLPGVAAASCQLGITAHLHDASADRLDHCPPIAASYLACLAVEPGKNSEVRDSGEPRAASPAMPDDRAWLAEAEAWYAKSLAISEILDDRPGMARTLANMSGLQACRGDDAGSLVLAIRACALLEERPDRHSQAHLRVARHWRAVGHERIAAAWASVTATSMPAALAALFEALADARL